LQELSAIPDDEIGPHLADTTVPKQTLEYIVDRITTFPQTFHLHPKLKPFLDKRREALHGGPVDWALAESLAFGSLVLEGTPVRLSGQDSGRGTFSQRHAVYADYEGYRARIRNHGHSCFLCEIVIRSQFHTTYEPEA
jgi:2-oxoglutarate dehydrogenase E1 component (EC 1.2.4.2)